MSGTSLGHSPPSQSGCDDALLWKFITGVEWRPGQTLIQNLTLPHCWLHPHRLPARNSGLFRPLLRYCAYSSARLSDHKSQLRYLHQEKCCVPSREPNVLWFYLNWNPSPTRCFWQDLMIDFYQSWQLGQLPRWQETGCGALPAKLMCAPKNVHFSRDVEAFSSHVNKN